MCKLVNKDVKVFVRDETALHKVPILVITTMPLVVLEVIVCFVIALVNYIVNGFVFSNIVVILLMLIGISWGIFTDKYFNFFNRVTYVFSDKLPTYSYDLASEIYGRNNTVVITLERIDSIKDKGKTLVLHGKFEKKAPRQQVQNLKKVVLRIDFKEKGTIIELLNSNIKTEGEV